MRFALTFCLVAVLVSCGDKVPESAASKELGNAPKQAVDKAVADVGKAVEQGSARSTDEAK